VVGTARLVVLPERGAITAITILLRSLEHCLAGQQLPEGDAGAVRGQVPGQGQGVVPAPRPKSARGAVRTRQLDGPGTRLRQSAGASGDQRPANDPTRYSAHSLRAGFVTYAHLRGASDRAIAHQTRHRSLATLGNYVRVQQAWTDNAATGLGL